MTAEPARPRRVEPLPRRVRGLLGGRAVIDSDQVELWFTPDSTPFYAIPRQHVIAAALPPDAVRPLPDPDRAEDPEGSEGSGGSEGSAGSAGAAPARPGRVSVSWDAVDAWFEEDEQVFVHPRDPYRRVDAFASSRTLRWEVAGQVIAASTRAVLLAETGMPGRWYLPALDVDQQRLHPTRTVTGCPYKGQASYWNIRCGGAEYPDAVWGYRHPLPEAIRIAGMLSADPTQVTIVADGQPLPAPGFHPRWLNPSLWL